jgi:O-antigen/teichoic acid export membrane protein
MRFRITMPATEASSSLVIRQAWGHAAIYAIGSLFLGVGQIAIAPLLIRRLSLADLGTYELFVALYVAGRSILLLSLSSALVYGYCRLCETEAARKGMVGTAVLLSVGCSVGLGAIGMALPGWPTWIMQTGGDVNAIGRVVILGLCLESVVQIGLAALRASQRPAMYGVIALVQLASTLTLVWVLVGVWHWGVQGVFDAFFLGNVPAAIALLPALRGRVTLRFSWTTAKKLLGFALTLVPVNVALLVIGISDRYFLRYSWDLPTVAVYALSYKLGSAAPQMISMPFLMAWPSFVYAGTSTPRTGQLVGSAALYLFAAGMLLVVMVSASARPLIMLFGGATFLAGVPVLPIVAVGVLLGGVMNIVMSAVVASGRFLWNMTALLVVSAIVLGLNALLIPAYGMLGAAAATLLGYALGAAASVVLARRLVVLDLQAFKWIKVSIGALMALLVGRELDDVSRWPALSLCATTAVSAVVYGGLLFVSGVIPRQWWGLAKRAPTDPSPGA